MNLCSHRVAPMPMEVGERGTDTEGRGGGGIEVTERPCFVSACSKIKLATCSELIYCTFDCQTCFCCGTFGNLTEKASSSSSSSSSSFTLVPVFAFFTLIGSSLLPLPAAGGRPAEAEDDASEALLRLSPPPPAPRPMSGNRVAVTPPPPPKWRRVIVVVVVGSYHNDYNYCKNYFIEGSCEMKVLKKRCF